MRHARRAASSARTRVIARRCSAVWRASLLANERIKTTEARAKEVRSLSRTHHHAGASDGDVHARRLALAEIGDRALAHKVFDDIAERYAEREGGYTRILKLGPRKGDGAPMVIIELVD